MCFARPQCAFFSEGRKNKSKMSHLAWLISISISLPLYLSLYLSLALYVVFLGDNLNPHMYVCVSVFVATITGLTGPVYG